MSRRKKSQNQPESGEKVWSHPVDVTDLVGEKKVQIDLDKKDLTAIRHFLKLQSLDMLRCDISLTRNKGAFLISVKGHISARLSQNCVITLEPVHEKIEEDFEAFYADYTDAMPISRGKKELYARHGMTDIPILDEKEDPEPLEDGIIDIGDVVLQFLSLAINPYPQKEGAMASTETVSEDANASPYKNQNPFAALRDWIEQKNSNNSNN